MENRKNGIIMLIFGIVFMVVSYMIYKLIELPSDMQYIKVLLVATFIVGYYMFSTGWIKYILMNKGYGSRQCMLLGILTIIGIIVAYLAPIKKKENEIIDIRIYEE